MARSGMAAILSAYRTRRNCEQTVVNFHHASDYLCRIDPATVLRDDLRDMQMLRPNPPKFKRYATKREETDVLDRQSVPLQ